MFSQKDAEILTHIRNNARKKVTKIAKDTNIPVTTIYDKLRAHEKKFIKKHTALLDFSKLGMHAKSHISIAVEREDKDALQKFLMQNPNVNSLCKINFGFDFMAEVIFKDFLGVENFISNLERDYKTIKVQNFTVIEELKREDFLTKPEHFGLIL
jgi:DNA-binding Lrp family transcriptional regulator